MICNFLHSISHMLYIRRSVSNIINDNMKLLSFYKLHVVMLLSISLTIHSVNPSLCGPLDVVIHTHHCVHSLNVVTWPWISGMPWLLYHHCVDFAFLPQWTSWMLCVWSLSWMLCLAYCMSALTREMIGLNIVLSASFGEIVASDGGQATVAITLMYR